ncbi:MAG: hypothetical protein NC093_03995 [Alistipes sp.]|nr:hypothetical protein [Alistipes sp.]
MVGAIAAKSAKNVVDYAKSDEAADKAAAAKEKLLSGASGVGNAVSGFGRKTSEFISSQRDKSSKSAGECFDDISEEIIGQSNNSDNIQNNDIHEKNIIKSGFYPEYEPSAKESHKNSNKTIVTTCCIVSAAAVTVTAAICLFFVIKQKNAEIEMYRNAASNSEIVYDDNEEFDEIITEKATEKSVEKEEEKTVDSDNVEEKTSDIESPIVSNKKVTICSPEEINNYPVYIDTARNAPVSDSYFLCDINDDGIPELFLTSDGSNEWIDQIYTIYDNNAVILVDGTGNWSRGLALCENGIIFRASSGGASSMVNSYEKYIGGDSLDLIEYIEWNYGELGECTIFHTVGDKTVEITSEQVEEINEKYTRLIFTSTPISDLVNDDMSDDIYSYPQYVEILETISYGRNQGWSSDDYYNNSLSAYYGAQELTNIEYSLRDLNYDNIPELFIYTTRIYIADGQPTDPFINLVEVYTISQYEAVQLCSTSHENIGYSLCENNCIKESNYGGNSEYKFYKYSGGDSLEFIEGILYDGYKTLYYNAENDIYELSEDEANDIMNRYSEYKN